MIYASPQRHKVIVIRFSRSSRKRQLILRNRGDCAISRNFCQTPFFVVFDAKILSRFPLCALVFEICCVFAILILVFAYFFRFWFFDAISRIFNSVFFIVLTLNLPLFFHSLLWFLKFAVFYFGFSRLIFGCCVFANFLTQAIFAILMTFFNF